MNIDKICPFRIIADIQGQCVSDCQLFISGKTSQEGSCALAAMPSLRAAIVALDHTLVNVGRTIGAIIPSGPGQPLLR
jgi:hypothetical protein